MFTTPFDHVALVAVFRLNRICIKKYENSFVNFEPIFVDGTLLLTCCSYTSSKVKLCVLESITRLEVEQEEARISSTGMKSKPTKTENAIWVG